MLWQPPQLWTKLTQLIVLSTDVRLIWKAAAVAMRTFNLIPSPLFDPLRWLTYMLSSASALADGTTTTSTPLARCATPGDATTAATPCHRCLSNLASLPSDASATDDQQLTDRRLLFGDLYLLSQLGLWERRNLFPLDQNNNNTYSAGNSHSTRAKGVLTFSSNFIFTNESRAKRWTLVSE